MRSPTLASLLLAAALAAQEDVADVPVSERTAGKDGAARWFLIGAAADARPPAAGFGLVLVLPGGDGSAGFQPFVKRIWKEWLPRGYLVAQLVSREQPDAKVIWPTAREVGRPKSVEAYLAAVIADARATQRIDPTRVFTLSWSSGGPAAYAASLDPELGIRGSLIAMSVFHEQALGALGNAKGLPYYLLHSPTDERCRFALAEKARDVLGKQGARVKLVTYAGGHAWNAESLGRITAGIRFLEGERPLPKGRNLLRNGDFEAGLEGWDVVVRNAGTDVTVEERGPYAGKRSLRIDKRGGMPPDLVSQRLDPLPKDGRLVVAGRIRCENAKNAWLKLRIRDANGRDLVEDVDVAHCTGTQEFELVQKDFELPAGARHAQLEFMMVLGGTVILDELVVLAVAGQESR